MTITIEQPWNDDRIKIGDRYIGCITKENADFIMQMQSDALKYRECKTMSRLSAVEELKATNEVAAYLRSNPDKLQLLAVEMGIKTLDGKLTVEYSGEEP